jgi:hypothetical protein
MFGLFSVCTRWLISGAAALDVVTSSIIAWPCLLGLGRVGDLRQVDSI